MKIFDQVEPFPNKVNFVDENNVLVGYDMAQDCCENAGWFIADEVCQAIRDSKSPDLADYRFAPEFFQKIDAQDHEYLKDGGMVIFRLVSPTRSELFLHLFNAHNGYYKHGFEMTVGNDKVREDFI